MARRILITAATGTVGSEAMRLLVDDLRAGTIELLGAARSGKSAERLRARGFTPVAFDYDAPETLRPALEGVDALFLITGYTVDMLVHSKRLLDAAKSAGVRHIVHLGALASDDTPHAHFAWHQLIERAIESMGFSFTHLRPNFFMDTVWAGLRHRPDRVVHFVGGRKVSWISAQDIAAVGVASLVDPDAHNGNTYPLAVEALTFAEIATILSDVTRRPVEYRPRNAAELLPILLKQGMDATYAASLAGGVAAIEAGDMPLADATYPTVETITGREGISWREFTEERKGDLAAI